MKIGVHLICSLKYADTRCLPNFLLIKDQTPSSLRFRRSNHASPHGKLVLTKIATTAASLSSDGLKKKQALRFSETPDESVSHLPTCGQGCGASLTCAEVFGNEKFALNRSRPQGAWESGLRAPCLRVQMRNCPARMMGMSSAQMSNCVPTTSICVEESHCAPVCAP